MQFHEVANIFPLLEGEELQALVEDIRQNGQIEPIWTYQGKIIDGRNRYRACQRLGLEPKAREWDGTGSLVQFVVSLNLHRRHLSSSQKAVVAVDVLPMLEAEAKDRMSEGARATNAGSQKIDTPQEQQGRATQQAAQVTGTNRQYVSDAKRIAEQAPEVLEKVRDGVLTIPDAKKVAALPEVKRQEVIERVAQEGINNLKNIVREAAHQEKRAQPLPTGQYDVIIADPPWKYNFSETTSRDIENQYPTMSLEDIKQLNIPSADNAALFLWATAPKLQEAFEVMQAWGFEYRTCAVWDKEVIGMGYWFRGQHELLLVGVKGQFSPPEQANRFSSVIRARRQGHSQKPERVYELLETMFPNGKRLEVFARNKREGWEVWGNEV